MSTANNKYLEKIAGRLDKAIGFVDDVLGHSHGRLRAEASTLAHAEARGRTAAHAIADADAAKARMINARVKAGIGAAAVGTGGFLGIHKYHQHKDNAIMAKIDQMYVDPYRN
jgi:predicted ATPase